MTSTTTSGRRRAALAVLLAGCCAAMLGAPAVAQDPTTTTTIPVGEGNSELKAEYDEVIGQEAELLAELADAQAAQKTANEELATLQLETTEKQFALLAATETLTAAEEKVDDAVAARKKAEAKVTAARERLRDQIVAAYVTGGDDQGVLEAFLSAQNGEQVGQALAYGHAVSDSTDALVEELDDARAKRASAAKAADDARDEAKTSRDEIAAAAAFLVEARETQQTLVDELNLQVLVEATTLREVQGRKAVVEGRINSMNRSSDGIAMILAQLQAGQPDWLPGSVEATTPLPGVEISSPYGMRHHPILGINRLHAGADMGASTGTTIHASADGIVAIAEVRGGYGNTVVIDHGNSLATLYAHTSEMLVKLGDTVKRGDVIALVGSTGLSTGPHLHFETRLKGMPVDPAGVVDFVTPVDYGEKPGGD